MRLRTRYLTTLTSVAVAWAVLMSGCATGDGANAHSGQRRASARPTAVGTVNTICPISGRAVRPDAPVALFQGAAIGFCGPRCPRAWMMRSDAQKRELIAGVASDPRVRVWGPPPRDPFR